MSAPENDKGKKVSTEASSRLSLSVPRSTSPLESIAHKAGARSAPLLARSGGVGSVRARRAQNGLAVRLFAKLFKQTVAKCGTASPGFATPGRIVATLADILRTAAFKCEMAADLAPSRPPHRIWRG